MIIKVYRINPIIIFDCIYIKNSKVSCKLFLANRVEKKTWYQEVLLLDVTLSEVFTVLTEPKVTPLCCNNTLYSELQPNDTRSMVMSAVSVDLSCDTLPTSVKWVSWSDFWYTAYLNDKKARCLEQIWHHFYP